MSASGDIETNESETVELCAICEKNQAFGVGEHVWPAWFLKDADKSGPPNSGWFANGIALTNKRGIPLEFLERQRQFLPACIECNSILNTLFEHSAKPIVRRLVDNNWAGDASAEEWTTIGQWFAKILLLTTNPRAKYEHPVIKEQMTKFDGEWDTSHYAWLIDGTAPPADLSLWLFRAHTEDEKSIYPFVVPSSVKDDTGAVSVFPLTHVTHAELSLTLFWHPGWAIKHPLVDDGRAWELLHTAPGGDFSKLPLLPHRAITWRRMEIELMPGKHLDGTLPPLYANLTAPIPPEMMGVAKYATPWRSPHLDTDETK